MSDVTISQNIINGSVHAILQRLQRGILRHTIDNVVDDWISPKTKNRYQDIGVILSNANSDYILLDPGVGLAGALAKQNPMNGCNNKS